MTKSLNTKDGSFTITFYPFPISLIILILSSFFADSKAKYFWTHKISYSSTVPGHDRHRSSGLDLSLNPARTSTDRFRVSFFVRICLLWNALPLAIHISAHTNNCCQVPPPFRSLLFNRLRNTTQTTSAHSVRFRL